jgi:hypothetical protein
MTTNHTPTPWHEGRYGVYADTTGYGRTHAQVALCENPANSVHIIRCVNAHDELVAALESFLCLSTPADLREDSDLHAVTQRARAALARARADGRK